MDAVIVVCSCVGLVILLLQQQAMRRCIEGRPLAVEGSAAALAAAGLGVWAGTGPRSAPVQVVPVVGPRQGGIGMVGSW